MGKNSLADSAKSGQETKAVDFDFVLTLEKVLGVEEIKAIVNFTGSSLETINRIMSAETCKTYVETTISHKVTTEVTKWQNDYVTGVKASVKGAAAAAGAKAAEAAATADAKIKLGVATA